MAITPELNSQPKLAARTGVAQTTIGRIIRGEGSPQAENIKRIADAFDCEVSFLFWSPERFRRAIEAGHRMRLPVGVPQISDAFDYSTGTMEKPQNPYTPNTKINASVFAALFNKLPRTDQHEIISDMEQRVRKYEALFNELLMIRNDKREND